MPDEKKEIDRKDTSGDESKKRRISSNDEGKQKQKKRRITLTNSADETSLQVDAEVKAPSPKPAKEKRSKQKKKRCRVCRKKLGLTAIQCRCGGLFCAFHRYSDRHECSFDYRADGASNIRRNNPKITAEKIQKI